MHRPLIMIAPNGARKTKSDLAQIPLSPEELAREASLSAAAGASIIHLHVRSENEGHTLDVETYKKAIAAIKAKVGDKIIIQATTEACDIYKPEEQIEMVRALMPEAVSCAIRELVPTPAHEDSAKKFFWWLAENKIWPQYIIYSPAELEYFADLKKRGIIPSAHDFVLFVLGKKQRVATADNYAQPQDLLPFVETLKKTGLKLLWAVCAFGGNENACMQEAFKHGGNARVGFENNHLDENNEVVESNADLVAQLVKTSGAKPLTAAEVRKLIR